MSDFEVYSVEEFRRLTARIADKDKEIIRLQIENTDLKALVRKQNMAVREAYEVWAGSDGIMQPATAPEAYVTQLIDQMATILSKVLISRTTERVNSGVYHE